MSALTSVIVSAYDDTLRLKWALESLCYQTVNSFEVIVVNDGGDEGLKSLVQKYKDRLKIRYLYYGTKSSEFHVAKARNAAAKVSAGSILQFLDADCILPADGVERHQSVHWMELSGIPNCFAYGGGLRWNYKEGLVAPFCSEIDFDKMRHLSKISAWTPDEDGHYAIGCNFSVSAELFCLLGGFDESIVGWGLEDADLCHRAVRYAQENNLILNFSCAADVVHLDHPRRKVVNRDDDAWKKRDAPTVANGGALKRGELAYAGAG